jgi:hypothetical protein
MILTAYILILTTVSQSNPFVAEASSNPKLRTKNKFCIRFLNGSSTIPRVGLKTMHRMHLERLKVRVMAFCLDLASD